MSVATQRNTQLDTERRNDRLSMRAAREAQNSLETTLTNVRGRQDGLDQAEAAARLHADGPNEVAHDRPPHVLVQLLQAFNNPFIYVLMTLSAISFFTDFWLPLQDGEETDLTGVIIVLCMVLVSGLMRFWQEYRSGKAAEALKAMVRNTATVLRRDERGMRGELREIPMGELVVGDIVRLSAGDMIPADIRLIESRDLFISQAVLTGEALPVEKYDTLGAVREKSAKRIAADQQDLLELPNICFMGTNVVSGTATAVVVATGARTYFGSLARSIVGSRAQTAFDRGVNSVSWLLIRFMLVMVPIVLLINGFTKGDWTEAFMFALAVAVGLTPEMLPMIVSANLAKGAVAMSRRKVVVKRLNAIQNFGAMDVLCTDKTGTLTQDRIILEHHVDVAGRRCDRVLQMAWLNSFHQSGMKNLMDRAVVAFVEQNPRITPSDAWRKVDELPFDFVRRRLSVILEGKDGEHLLVCKGAVEEMLEIATRVHQDGVDLPLDEERRRALLALAEQYNRDGFRVLLLGTRSLSRTESQAQYGASDERDLVIAGLLTFLDPPKETAGPAIAALRENGVAVKVLTGDNPVVSAKICREVGLDVGEPLLGRDIDLMDDATLQRLAEERTVFAKLTPLQKSRVLKALQGNGHTVGFLGDGINDAPALRDADVGISVDSGTDIAKESADIILLEKKPDGPGGGRYQGPRDLRQHHEVPEHDCQLQLRQRVLGTGGQRLHPLPADAGDPPAAAEPDVRHLPAVAAVGQDGQGIPRQAAQVGLEEHRPLHGLDRPDLVDLRHHHLRADVVRVRRQQPGNAVAVPVRLVHRGPALADPGGAHAAYPEDSLHPEHRGAAGDADDRAGDGAGHLRAVLAAGSDGRPAAAAVGVLPLAGGHAALLLRHRADHEDPLHPPLRPVVLSDRPGFVPAFPGASASLAAPRNAHRTHAWRDAS